MHGNGIIFVHSESTKRLSAQTYVPIAGGGKLKVVVSHYLKSNSEEVDDEVILPSIPDILLKAPEQQSPSNIVNRLPDDCLRTIFEASASNIMDLGKIANVCRRFHGIANKIFHTKHKSINDATFNELKDLYRKEYFFRTFGSSVKSITGFYGLNEIEFGMVAKYCTNIKELECVWTSSEERSFDELRTIFARLEVLTIEFDNIDIRLGDWFDGEMKLKKLSLRSQYEPSEDECSMESGGEDEEHEDEERQDVPDIRFRRSRYSDESSMESGSEDEEREDEERQVERSHNEDKPFVLPNRSLSPVVDLTFHNMKLPMAEPFFRANPQLQVLNLISSKVALDFNVLIDCLPNLTELVLDNATKLFNHANYSCNVQHTKLRTLTINPEDVNLAEAMVVLPAIVQHKIPLENLTIHCDCYECRRCDDDFINAICQITTIKCLDFEYISFKDDNQMIRLADELPNLTKLTICIDPRFLTLGGILTFMEKAGEHFNHLHVKYWYDVADKTETFDETELERMSRIGRDRGINLKMSFMDTKFMMSQWKRIDVSIHAFGLNL